MCIVNIDNESDVRLFKYNCSLCLRLELCFQPKLFYFEVIKKKAPDLWSWPASLYYRNINKTFGRRLSSHQIRWLNNLENKAEE